MSESRKTVGAAKLKRKSFFVNALTLRRARKALGVASDAEAVRQSVAQVVEMDEFWRFMKKSRGAAKPGSFREP
jgi:hypothetical protein